MDLDKIIEKKIDRLEKWAQRLQKEIQIWKSVAELQKNSQKRGHRPKKAVQTEIFEFIG